MVIYIMDTPGHIVDLVEKFESVIFNRQYNGIDDFELVAPATDENMERLQVGRYLVLESNMHGTKMQGVMVIETRHIAYNITMGWTLTVRGCGLKGILKRRVVWQQTTLNGDLSDVVAEVVRTNAIAPKDANRAIPGLVLGTQQQTGKRVDIQLLGETLADWISAICKDNGVGWDITVDGDSMVFGIYSGVDRTYAQTAVPPVVFSPEFDNLESIEYEKDLGNYSNAALVGGEERGSSKQFATVGGGVGLDRYESYIDGSSVSGNGIITAAQYDTLLATYGQTALAKTATTERVDGKVITNGMYAYGTDYFLGDIVQIEALGIKATARITEIIYSEDEQGWSLNPTFANWQ